MEYHNRPLYIPSLILGIAALASLWFTIGISGVVCGIIGIIISRKNKYQYNTSAGFVLNLIALIIGSIFLIIIGMFLLVVFLFPNSVGAYYVQDFLEIIL